MAPQTVPVATGAAALKAASRDAAPELAIILPTRNERGNLPSLLQRIDAALPDLSWEVVVVDDNSPDGTAELARELAARDPRVRVIHRFNRRGLASAAIEGWCATAAPFVAVMDADHQHDPAMLPAMLAAVRDEGADIAVASRFVAGGSAEGLSSRQRERGSIWANRLARKVAGVALSDPMSGFFLLRADRARALSPRLSGIGFKILLDLLASADAPLKVAELPLRFAARREGESKLDRAVALDFLVGLYDKTLGRIVPTRFALFATVGAVGVGVHLAVLTLLFRVLNAGFLPAQTAATIAAMTFNFWLNNWFTYQDRRLSGWRNLLRGWAAFCLTCALGAVANVAVAGFVVGRDGHWLLAALAGIVAGAVWNYALSSKFVWGRYGTAK